MFLKKEKINKPKGNPYIFIDVVSYDGDVDGECFDIFNYDEAENLQLRDIKSTIYCNLRLLHNQQIQEIPIIKIKRELIKYKKYFIETCNLDRNSIEITWLNYWLAQFLLSLNNKN